MQRSKHNAREDENEHEPSLMRTQAPSLLTTGPGETKTHRSGCHDTREVRE